TSSRPLLIQGPCRGRSPTKSRIDARLATLLFSDGCKEPACLARNFAVFAKPSREKLVCIAAGRLLCYQGRQHRRDSSGVEVCVQSKWLNLRVLVVSLSAFLACNGDLGDLGDLIFGSGGKIPREKLGVQDEFVSTPKGDAGAQGADIRTTLNIRHIRTSFFF